MRPRGWPGLRPLRFAVASIVGSIGLIGAVPITTALAARLVPESALGDAGDDHGDYH